MVIQGDFQSSKKIRIECSYQRSGIDVQQVFGDNNEPMLCSITQAVDSPHHSSFFCR
ncbi:hypothetical protein BV352_03366 [Pseudomonas syringae pv. actinidiae]|nr:hypothetical protein BV352_03366 [Pseudomonas syringae pv. actinidiae]